MFEANDDYTDRLPSPPRINVPMHTWARSPVTPSFVSRPDGLFDGYTIQPGFFKAEWGEWDYTHRRLAQPILPFLYLGPTNMAKDPDFLAKAGITMTVVVRHGRPGQFHGTPAAARVAASLDVHCEMLDVFDNQMLSHSFSAVVGAINKHLLDVKARTGRLGGVLVCDETGNERAAAIVAAYIMETTECGLVAAVQLLQAQRFCVNLDDAMKHTLQAYHDILTARRDVGAPNPTLRPLVRQSILCNLPAGGGAGPRRSSSKRPLDNSDDGPTDGDGDSPMQVDDPDGAGGPRNFAPFADG